MSPVWQMTMNGTTTAYPLAHSTVASARSMLPLAKYDPFLRLKDQSTSRSFISKKKSNTALEIRTTLLFNIVTLDS